MNSCLPFPRGTSMADLTRAGITPTATMWDRILGQKYEVQDDKHSTGLPVILMAVQVEAKLTLDTTYYGLLYAFDTDSKDWGRQLSTAAASNTTGALAVPIDDHYKLGRAFLEMDIIWVILKGPGYATTAAADCSLTAHDPIISGATGRLYKTQAAATHTVLGTIDATTTTEDQNVLVFWDIDLKKEVSS